ncbi:hypothetical protein DM02DRAFT_694871 [Periconia macrospinosa]|uniref:Uncharacterized protein n=1 Tax=Periconia macrospinosa TaxID=97972 RepID=A0A2V1D6Z6_9PLEO|nr:hypothetical protein DM02DRAFT_694871 [Periconia macrospinosa]
MDPLQEIRLAVASAQQEYHANSKFKSDALKRLLNAVSEIETPTTSQAPSISLINRERYYMRLIYDIATEKPKGYEKSIQKLAQRLYDDLQDEIGEHEPHVWQPSGDRLNQDQEMKDNESFTRSVHTTSTITSQEARGMDDVGPLSDSHYPNTEFPIDDDIQQLYEEKKGLEEDENLHEGAVTDGMKLSTSGDVQNEDAENEGLEEHEN